MQHIPLATSSGFIPAEQFWRAIIIYHDKPHVINRKLAGVVECYFYELLWDKTSKLSDIFTYHGVAYETRKLASLNKESLTKDFIVSMVEPYDKNHQLVEKMLEDCENSQDGVFISVRISLSRVKNCGKCVEVVVMDKENSRATFLCASQKEGQCLTPPFLYHIERTQNGIVRICLESIEDCDTGSAEWLAATFFPKFMKWCEGHQNEDRISSLSLIDVELYYSLYEDLKKKYGRDIIEIWPENTDPQKYVHEDVAIASYLICLWKSLGDSKPSFFDLGCGNGLLVHILNHEGYKGTGLDVRKRKIWNFYPEETVLEVFAVTPSPGCLFPDADWVIGNHSDELTPWLPVIALRSSRKTNFFCLPCCPYDFSGKKYERRNSSISQYTDYLDYVKEISDLCGFDTKVDRLRIPSTKRTCLYGVQNLTQEEFEEIDERVTEYIKSCCTTSDDDSGKWISNFQPRSSVEPVRNCTKLDKELRDRIIKSATSLLLKTENYVKKDNGELWNKGGTVLLSHLPQYIYSEDLEQLKNECGGLKTLLKNHRYLFEVVTDYFRLRKPYKLNEETQKYREKPCWFYSNHPNGCLYDSHVCAYKHC